jgi:hypothetical protein
VLFIARSFKLACIVDVDRENVEADGIVSPLSVRHQQVSRCAYELVTLCRIDRFCGRDQATVTARSDFHDNEYRTVHAHKVELAETAAVTHLQHAQTTTSKKRSSAPLPSTTRTLTVNDVISAAQRCETMTAGVSVPEVGSGLRRTGLPSTNCAIGKRRRTRPAGSSQSSPDMPDTDAKPVVLLCNNGIMR